MKFWALCTMIVSAAALAACGSSSGGGNGGGGSGGSASTSTGSKMTTTGSSMTTTVTSTTGTGMTTTSSGTGGSASCDNKGVCEDTDMDPTNDCVGCALAGECADEYAACTGDQDCVALNMCFGMCGQGDTQCLQSCAQQHPTGYQLYNQVATCAICTVCPVDCDGPGSGCP